MSSFNTQSFDITKLVEQCRGRKLEELYKENYRIITNRMGEFMELVWQVDDLPCNLKLLNTRKKLLNNLKTVHYIGEFVENRLKSRGIRTIKDLRFLNLRYGKSATSILELIKKKDYKALKENRYIDDLDVSFCFNNSDLLFLDIETLGFHDSAIILIGTGWFTNQNFEIHLFFARKLEEEIAICEHLKSDVLPKFKSFVTY
ncbi:hypothetical protein LCGC14_1470300, partial [marine sediment metagenome]